MYRPPPGPSTRKGDYGHAPIYIRLPITEIITRLSALVFYCVYQFLVEVASVEYFRKDGIVKMGKAYYWYRPHPYFKEFYPGKVLNLISDSRIIDKYFSSPFLIIFFHTLQLSKMPIDIGASISLVNLYPNCSFPIPQWSSGWSVTRMSCRYERPLKDRFSTIIELLFTS